MPDKSDAAYAEVIYDYEITVGFGLASLKKTNPSKKKYPFFILIEVSFTCKRYWYLLQKLEPSHFP